MDNSGYANIRQQQVRRQEQQDRENMARMDHGLQWQRENPDKVNTVEQNFKTALPGFILLGLLIYGIHSVVKGDKSTGGISLSLFAVATVGYTYCLCKACHQSSSGSEERRQLTQP